MKSIFPKECPVPLREVEKLSHVILMQLLPALFENDIVTFGKSIDAIQELGFKKREVELQPVSSDLMQALRDGGAIGTDEFIRANGICFRGGSESTQADRP